MNYNTAELLVMDDPAFTATVAVIERWANERQVPQSDVRIMRDLVLSAIAASFVCGFHHAKELQ